MDEKRKKMTKGTVPEKEARKEERGLRLLKRLFSGVILMSMESFFHEVMNEPVELAKGLKLLNERKQKTVGLWKYGIVSQRDYGNIG